MHDFASGNRFMSEKNKYKDTLNLPKTSFDMRAGLLAKEPAIQAQWDKDDIYGKLRQYREDAPVFVLHDGPPYANGNIHMGTALNKILKDIVIRYKSMAGFNARYLPGWDCHGLPIEAKVMDELGDGARAMEPMAIRQRCHDYANSFVDVQREQFLKLGVMGEFEDPYITMHPQYEADTLEVFARLVERGVVYRQLKPVHWSIDNQTALADAELEYHDRKDPSIYVAFRVDFAADAIPNTQGDLSLGVWTTTPWTLPANLAVAVHPAYEYAAVKLDTADGVQTVILASDLVANVVAALGKNRSAWLKGHAILSTFTGQVLLDAGMTYHHPLHAKTCPVVAADYVTLEDGTGLVHTAPGHGLEDYHTGLNFGLDIYCPVLPDGTFDETAPEWMAGKSVWDANPMIVDHLKAAGALLADELISHSYPHDWRSKTPTIFRATEQWFVSVDTPIADMAGKSLRQLAQTFCSKDLGSGGVDFIPDWGRNRMLGMLASRPDWCLSRQRAWGLPIPVFFNPQGQPLLTAASVRAVAAKVNEHGSDVWFSMTPTELLSDYDPAEDAALESPADFSVDQLVTGKDIFDVWFDSGSSWFAVAIGRALTEEVPVDLYLEGSDQHRGWFQLSLLPALGAVGCPPFKTILTHGFVVTEDGHKMSKSLGNAIDVIDQLEHRGADILRLWVASQNYQDDIRCSEALIAQAEEAYRKIRNTLRFCMGSCGDFDPAHHTTQPSPHSIDLWMKLQLHELIRDVREAFDKYDFHRATRRMYEFCTVQASSVYMAAVKDRLYCESPNALRRRATQTVMHEMLLTLVKLLAPILPHTCEEAWQHIPFRDIDEPHSVHLANLPTVDDALLRMAEDIRPVNTDSATAESDHLEVGPEWVWDRLLDLRGAGLLKLEALRNAGVKNPLDTEAVFIVPPDNDDAKRFIETYQKELEDMLGVGFTRIETGDLPEATVVDVEVFDTREKYPRCERSWKRRPDVGANAAYPDLCARDAGVMEELKG
jgi:isoleucyl-tRNA synthetase